MILVLGGAGQRPVGSAAWKVRHQTSRDAPLLWNPFSDSEGELKRSFQVSPCFITDMLEAFILSE